jgi:chromosome partitioning protein
MSMPPHAVQLSQMRLGVWSHVRGRLAAFPFSGAGVYCAPLPDPRHQTVCMSRVIAIANQKGGVGKTTTAINLGAGLAVAERRTLIVDMDPQGNATSGLGLARGEVEASMYDVLVEGLGLESVVRRGVHFPNLDLAPSSQDLVGAEVELVQRSGRELALRGALEPLREAYDYILVDSPPSLGLLTLNTLAAADTVLIPIQCEFYALEGLSQLLNTVRLVQHNLNPALEVEGVLLTMFDQRLNLSRQVAEEAKEYFGDRVFASTIPRNVRLAEAPSFGKPIVLYDVLSQGSQSYLALAREIVGREAGAAGVRSRREGAA